MTSGRPPVPVQAPGHEHVTDLGPALLGRRRPSFPTVLAIDVTGNGFSHVVPGGGATAAALRLRLYDRTGVSTPDAAAAAAVLAAVLVTAIAGLVAVLMVRPDQVVTVTHAIAARLPLVRPQLLEGLVRSLADQVRLLLHSPRASRRATLWGLGYWWCDATSLHLGVWAFGGSPDPGGLLTTYALVSLLALLRSRPGAWDWSRARRSRCWCLSGVRRTPPSWGC